MVLAVKCWMKNAGMTNDLFLTLKISDMAPHILIKKKKKSDHGT
jgi:hypothetical protein